MLLVSSISGMKESGEDNHIVLSYKRQERRTRIFVSEGIKA
jgi:hypothetical protein